MCGPAACRQHGGYAHSYSTVPSVRHITNAPADVSCRPPRALRRTSVETFLRVFFSKAHRPRRPFPVCSLLLPQVILRRSLPFISAYGTEILFNPFPPKIFFWDFSINHTDNFFFDLFAPNNFAGSLATHVRPPTDVRREQFLSTDDGGGEPLSGGSSRSTAAHGADDG